MLLDGHISRGGLTFICTKSGMMAMSMITHVLRSKGPFLCTADVCKQLLDWIDTLHGLLDSQSRPVRQTNVLCFYLMASSCTHTWHASHLFFLSEPSVSSTYVMFVNLCDICQPVGFSSIHVIHVNLVTHLNLQMASMQPPLSPPLLEACLRWLAVHVCRFQSCSN